MTTVLFAIEDTREQEIFQEVVATRDLHIEMIVPENIGDVDRLITDGTIDIIITDLHFQNGGFANWLHLWQHPFVLLADWSEYHHIDDIVKGQTADFVIRDGEFRHIEFLPLVIKKVLNNVESIDRHNLNLRMTEERYRELVQALPDIVYSLDASGHFIFINDSVRALGWNPVELIGKHFKVLLDDGYVEKVSREHVLKGFRGKETGPDAAPKLFDERRTGPRRTRDLEVKLQRRDDQKMIEEVYGSIIAYGEVNAVGFSAFSDTPGETGSVGIIRDITERKEALRLLDNSLRERDVLLAEIHHRVKNNLQVISSLLNLQSAGIEDVTALARFADAQMQIQSMALVHEQLYRSDSYSSVELEAYIPSLCEHLFEAYAVPRDRIALDITVDPIPVTMQQAVPIALLLNELISNSLKYAFPDDARGTVHVFLKRTDNNQLQLDVYDDGIGLPADFDIASSSTLGHTLVTGLSSQLGGNMTVDGSSGTRFTLVFPVDETP